MTSRGRPPIGDRVPVRFPAPILARLDQIAAEQHIPRAEVVRRLVAQALGD